MADQQEVVLSNGAIFSYLEWPITQISSARHCWTYYRRASVTVYWPSFCGLSLALFTYAREHFQRHEASRGLSAIAELLVNYFAELT